LLEVLSNLLADLLFIFQRLDWWSVLDIALVTAIFFMILSLLRDTQAMVLLRGVLFLIVLISLLTSLEVLPAFSWLMRTTLPALLLAIPVIFAPEIRRALERLGRASDLISPARTDDASRDTISSIVSAVARLSSRQHGALIVMQRHDDLEDYVKTGVRVDAEITAEMLLQIFYPNTPLHDGAVITHRNRLLAASCVMPLSSSGILTSSPERQMGLRHRAALGISEISDAIVVVVSEETGTITIVHGGRMIRRLDPERLESILRAFFYPSEEETGLRGLWKRLTSSEDRKAREVP
jgi:diadenylate cyclase